MFDQAKLAEIGRALKRLFALPISRSTFREFQNIIFKASDGNVEQANVLLEVLMGGDPNSEKAKGMPAVEIKRLIHEFSVVAWVAKDVLEKGEFLSLITSDLITVPGQNVYSNRIRRIDGQEFHFVSDVESTVQLMTHFAARLQEIDKQKALGSYQKEIAAIKNVLDAFIKK